MLSLAVAALLDRGVIEPLHHIVVATQGSIATLVLTREPFSAIDLQVLDQVARDFEHRFLVHPNVVPESPALAAITAARSRQDLKRISSELTYRFDAANR
jgi:hypothetical protein